jgi:hypothetical protein
MEFEVRPASEVERFVAFARANGCQCRLLFSGRPHRLTFDVPLARDPTEARRIALDVIASFSAENTRGRRGIGSSSPLGSRRSGTSRVGRPPPRRHRYATFRPSPRSRTTPRQPFDVARRWRRVRRSLQFHCRGQGVESPRSIPLLVDQSVQHRFREELSRRAPGGVAQRLFRQLCRQPPNDFAPRFEVRRCRPLAETRQRPRGRPVGQRLNVSR